MRKRSNKGDTELFKIRDVYKNKIFIKRNDNTDILSFKKSLSPIPRYNTKQLNNNKLKDRAYQSKQRQLKTQ